MGSVRESEPRPPVRLDYTGVCIVCGLETSFHCAVCKKAAICPHDTRLCWSDPEAQEAHARVCTHPRQKAPVLPPDPKQKSNPAVLRLRTTGHFGLDPVQHLAHPRSFPVLRPYGLIPLSVDVAACSALARLFQKSRDEEGFFTIGGQRILGYENYMAIPCALNSSAQVRCTAMILARSNGEQVNLGWCLNRCEPMQLIVTQVCKELDVEVERVRQVHLLRQSCTQAQFTWHDDFKDLSVSNRSSMITVVILLEGHSTGVQLWGYRVYKYPEVGSGVAFSGAVTHRSVYQVEGSLESPTVVKFGMFLW